MRPGEICFLTTMSHFGAIFSEVTLLDEIPGEFALCYLHQPPAVNNDCSLKCHFYSIAIFSMAWIENQIRPQSIAICSALNLMQQNAFIGQNETYQDACISFSLFFC